MKRILQICTYRKQLILLLFSMLSFIISTAQNAIVMENALSGNPSSEWDISGSGDASIQGFATDISVNKGDTVYFKINTDAVAYTISIYRLGYYNGNGARLVGTGTITEPLPQTQPSPINNTTTGLVDCVNWDTSAYWHVPTGAVSGVYIARLKRTNNSGASHIVFIVRDDASTSDLFFQTSDATWQAYNVYGNNSLNTGTTAFPGGRAVKVSYNRPFVTRAGGGGGEAMADWLFNAEYPMIRFLERNGYNISYTTNIDAARRGNLIQQHKIFLSVGHDQYWSAEQRASVEAARNAGVHLAFFSGNEIYWKTRWEKSADPSGNENPSGTSYRTLVCYKEGTEGELACGSKCDNTTSVWTGLWRSGGNYDAGLPENALSGQISTEGSTTAMRVPARYKNLRFWRNTSIASMGVNDTITLPMGTLGHAWDWDQFLNTYPLTRMVMSGTVSTGKTHKISLYRHSSGAWVFGAGTVQWAWGLDDTHDRGNTAPSVAMQQATVNLFADMGNVQPGSLMAGLVAASPSSDTQPPVSFISSPSSTALIINTQITIKGNATDAGGGTVGGVEVSLDDGVTWKAATGTTTWAYLWTPTVLGNVTIKVRSFDDSGNMEAPGTAPADNAIIVNVTPPLTDGHGGPILVISNTSNPFSQYTAEILRAEGLNEFSALDITAVNTGVLNNYDVVILGEMALTSPQITMLTDWTNAGGTLIAFRPAAGLASLMGITSAGGTLNDKYLLVNTASGPGVGIVNQTIQFHGSADLYTLSTATSIATLYSNATTATTHPAITTRTVGSNGRAIAFTYDLAKSIIYTRQGNPAWAGQERDGVDGLRSTDMFYGNKPGDVQPDWIDFNKIAIPQADEQQRLLVNIIITGNLHRKPLPRFWFLPKGLKAAIVMTGDDHAIGGTIGRFNQQMGLGPNTPQAVADWTAIRSTSYVYPGTLTNAQAAAFEADGFEIALHAFTGCTVNWTPASLETDLTTQLAQLASQLLDVPYPSTNRTHCVSWSDWSTLPQVEAAHGIRLDVNYYYWPTAWVADRPGMFTGSGMPMRFANINGGLIDCYQVPTQMTDESNISYGPFCDALLDKALGPEGYYGVFATNMHTDLAQIPGSDAIMASAIQRGVPIISAKQMLNWLDGRNGSSFGSISMSGNQLSFSINALSAAHNLKTMLPFHTDGGNVVFSITRDGNTVSFTAETIKGIKYAFFNASSGNYTVTYAPAGTLTGTVVLQARPAAPHAQWVIPVQVNLYTPGNTTTPVYSYNVTTNQSGVFTIDDIPTGTYIMAVKNSHTLQRVKTGQAIAGGNNPVNFGTLLEGDVYKTDAQYNIVNAFDLGTLLASYNKAAGDLAFIPNADLNGDGYVNAFDLGILLSNYNVAGESP